MSDKLTCPYCGAGNIKTLRMIYESGLSNRHGHWRHHWLGFGPGGLRYYLGGSRGDYVNQSKLSKQAEPPTSSTPLFFLLWLVSFLYEPFLYLMSFMLVVSIFYDVVFLWRAKRRYDKTWRCLRCGRHFTVTYEYVDEKSKKDKARKEEKPEQSSSLNQETQQTTTIPQSVPIIEANRGTMSQLAQQAYEAAKYLEANGFTNEHLASIHHSRLKGGKETFKKFYNYWKDAGELRENNSRLANRLLYIKEQHLNGEKEFGRLCEQAITRFPF